VNFGFNTDVQVSGVTLHVQTEDRGKRNPVLDTIVYSGGQVLHRRKRSYAEHLNDEGFSDEVIKKWLEEQHRSVIEDLRSGILKIELPAPPAAMPAAAPPPAAPVPAQQGIQVQLTNPASWLKAGSATLLLEVRTRQAREPVEHAQIEVMFDGAQQPLSFTAATDPQGRAEVGFPMPHLGSAGADLVIRASSPAGQDEIRYSLRAKIKTPPAS
jgi:hypothetical protein